MELFKQWAAENRVCRIELQVGEKGDAKLKADDVDAEGIFL